MSGSRGARATSKPPPDGRPAPRPEELWSGEFGDAYVDRNSSLDARRESFWRRMIQDGEAKRILEVGCGQGGNLIALARVTEPWRLWGIDINHEALRRARAHVADANLVHGSARELPFRDGYFDLVFTVGVLIHQPDDALLATMDEIVRVSRRYVMCCEYDADEPTEVPYRGYRGALFKRDYARLYLDRFPSLQPRGSGFLGAADGFDDVTFHRFERSGAIEAEGSATEAGIA